jgi:hypothetical protein
MYCINQYRSPKDHTPFLHLSYLHQFNIKIGTILGPTAPPQATLSQRHPSPHLELKWVYVESHRPERARATRQGTGGEEKEILQKLTLTARRIFASPGSEAGGRYTALLLWAKESRVGVTPEDMCLALDRVFAGKVVCPGSVLLLAGRRLALGILVGGDGIDGSAEASDGLQYHETDDKTLA